MDKKIVIDGHVHLYPDFNLELCFDTAFKNLNRIAKDHIPVCLLTERFDCHAFEEIQSQENIGKYNIVQTDEGSSVKIIDTLDEQKYFYLMAGRQIVVKENLEICALASTMNLEDRKYNINDTIQAVCDNRGIPALNWAPGKWMFARKKVVQNVINTVKPDSLLISDTTMRPSVWPTPILMREAMKKGFKVIAGTDPLPFDGEEKLVGSYAATLNGPFDENKPAASIKALLKDPAVQLTRVGRRSCPGQFAKRQYKIMSLKS